jgi:hypothetical protein
MKSPTLLDNLNSTLEGGKREIYYLEMASIW